MIWDRVRACEEIPPNAGANLKFARPGRPQGLHYNDLFTHSYGNAQYHVGYAYEEDTCDDM